MPSNTSNKDISRYYKAQWHQMGIRPINKIRITGLDSDEDKPASAKWVKAWLKRNHPNVKDALIYLIRGRNGTRIVPELNKMFITLRKAKAFAMKAVLNDEATNAQIEAIFFNPDKSLQDLVNDGPLVVEIIGTYKLNPMHRKPFTSSPILAT